MRKKKELFRVNVESGTIHCIAGLCASCYNSWQNRKERYKDCHTMQEAEEEMVSRNKDYHKCLKCHW